MTRTYKTIDELEILRALRIAVTGSVLSTSLVIRKPGHTTIGIHLREIQSTVKTAGMLRYINVEGEFLVEEFELLVRLAILEEIDTRADIVRSSRASSDKVKSQSTAGSANAICARVVGSINGTVLRAGSIIGAERCIPSVTSVAVGVAAR